MCAGSRFGARPDDPFGSPLTPERPTVMQDALTAPPPEGRPAESPGVCYARYRNVPLAAPPDPGPRGAALARPGPPPSTEGPCDSWPLAAPRSAADALYSLGHWLLTVDRTSDAADVLRVLLLASPEDERGWLGLGECHERTDQPRIALELYSAGSVAAAPSVRCQVGRARILRAFGRDDEADEAARLALELAEATADASLQALALAEVGSL